MFRLVQTGIWADKGTVEERSSGSKLGIPEIDREHEKLLCLLSRFEALAAKSEDEDMEDLLATVKSFLDEHFANEEAIMRNSGYPYLPEHQTLHEDMRLHLHCLTTIARSGIEKPAAHGVTIVRGWIEEHVNSADRRLADFLHASAAVTSRRAR